VAHKDGLAVNVETTSGDAQGVKITMPERGVLAHANHFVCHEFAPLDGRVALHPHSLFRHDCMQRAVMREDAPLTIDDMTATLRSHQNHPDGICAHPDPRVHPLEQRTTVASVVADLTQGTFWFTPGPPCQSTYRRFDYAARLNAAGNAAQPH
jgi:isopenicillin-N N-acyltransferase-like protein